MPAAEEARGEVSRADVPAGPRRRAPRDAERHRFFVVTDGEATVTVDGKQVATLTAGDHFGEVALVSRAARTATVTARTELHCLEIAFSDFREFAHANPDVTWKLLQHVVALLQPAR